MNNEIKNVVKKAAKIAGATCVAAGAVALVTSGAALKAMAEGAKYLKDAVTKILDDNPEQQEAEVQAEEVAAESVAAEEPVAEAEIIAEAEPIAAETAAQEENEHSEI